MSIFQRIFKRQNLRERVETLEKIVAEEITKKTISKTTTAEEEPPTPADILDEWFNGKEQEWKKSENRK